MKITTDMIVGTGLVVALLAAIFCGGSVELQTTLGSGLIGYLGRTAIEHTGGEAKSVTPCLKAGASAPQRR